VSKPTNEFLELANRGIYFARKGRYEEAMVCFDKLIEISPRRGTALYNKSTGLCLLGKYEEALPLLEEAFRLEPDLKQLSKENIAFDGIRNDERFKRIFL